jgi:hypothetical protein
MPSCPYCGDTRLDYSGDGDLFVCAGCGAEGESVSLVGACILIGADGENPDDCTTHDHEEL